MTADQAMLEAVQLINPRTARRARIIVVAAEMMSAGASRADAARMIQERYEVTRFYAMRAVSAALDLRRTL